MSTSSPVNSNHQLENDKELYLSLISLCLDHTANTTRLSFQINLYITMAVFAWIEFKIICIFSKFGMAKGLIWGLMHLCHLLFQNQFIQIICQSFEREGSKSIFVLKIIIWLGTTKPCSRSSTTLYESSLDNFATSKTFNKTLVFYNELYNHHLI